MKTASGIKMAATVASVVRASTRPGAPSIPERVQAVPRLVRCTLERTYAGTTLKRLGLVAGAVAYVASPIDLLPEAILPVVGAVVISWAIKAFFEETDRFIAWEAGQGVRVRPSRPPRERAGVLRLTARATEATSGGTTGAEPDTSACGGDRVRLPEGARQAATDYVLESVRKRLER
jgi:uncharacterized membrane protein YkvA (DUF1232 family)